MWFCTSRKRKKFRFFVFILTWAISLEQSQPFFSHKPSGHNIVTVSWVHFHISHLLRRKSNLSSLINLPEHIIRVLGFILTWAVSLWNEMNPSNVSIINLLDDDITVYWVHTQNVECFFSFLLLRRLRGGKASWPAILTKNPLFFSKNWLDIFLNFQKLKPFQIIAFPTNPPDHKSFFALFSKKCGILFFLVFHLGEQNTPGKKSYMTCQCYSKTSFCVV